MTTVEWTPLPPKSIFWMKDKVINGYSMNIFSLIFALKMGTSKYENRCFHYDLIQDTWFLMDNCTQYLYLFFFFFSLQSISQQEIYWAANLWSSNWLRKNLNEFLNIQLKSIVTLFILGPRQIEIETINGNTSFWKNEFAALQWDSLHTLTYTLMCTHIHTFIKFYIQEECMTGYMFGILNLWLSEIHDCNNLGEHLIQ